MEKQKNPQICIETVGEIMLAEDGEFFWMLPQIYYCTYESCLASPYFRFDFEDWRLVIMPSDGDIPVLSNKDFWGLFLWRKGCKTLKQVYNVELSIKLPNDKKEVLDSGKVSPHYGFGEWNLLECDYDESYFYHGYIRICCLIKKDNPTDFSLLSHVENAEENKITEKIDEKHKDSSESKVGVDRLIQNFQNLLDSELCWDVILKTSDRDFRAHRCILSARSPVFASMFQHDMAEKKTGEVDISDCSTAGFKVFLQYLYSVNKNAMSPSTVLDLYYIADKYQVSDLKSVCVEYMMNNLTIDNFCDVMALSLRHHDSDLQKFATHFFCKNVKKIVETVQWQKYLKENPTQANELIIKAVNA